MRKILISIIMVLLILVLGISMYKGFNIGKFRIASIQDLKILNQKLDDKIIQVDNLNTRNYTDEKNKLNTSINNLETKKAEYLDLVNSKSISEIEEATKEEKYEIEYLWTSLGFKARANNLWLKAVLTNPSNGLTGQYDINITVRGGYAEIENYIRSIEKDVNLGFKIEEFSMIPYQTDEEKEKNEEATGETLEAKFTIRNVVINLVNISGTTISTETSSEEAE